MKLKYSRKRYGAHIKNFNENAEWLKNEDARCNGLGRRTRME